MKNLLDKIGKFLLTTSIVFSLQTKSIGYSETKYVDDRTVIVLDPGHGMNNKGKWPMDLSDTTKWEMDLGEACYGDYCEADINLEIAKNVKKMLNPIKYNVILTREDNLMPTPLEFRPEFANKNNADLFMSIHVNKNHKRYVKGFEVYYRDDKSENLAYSTAENFLQYTPISLSKRGIVKENYIVLKDLNCPSVLIEVAYMSNPDDRKKMLSNLQNISLAIVRTIEED